MKKFTLFIYILTVLTVFQSCEKDKLEGYVEFQEVKQVNMLDKSGEPTTKTVIKTQSEKIPIDKKNKIIKHDTLDFNPFKDFLNRDFFERSEVSKYFIEEIPGHIFVKNEDGDYEKVSLQRFVINNAYPKTKLLDKVYYNDRVTDRKALNALSKILGLSITKKQIAELTLKDESTTYLPGELIDTARVNNLARRLGKDEIENYYFATGATVSSVIHRLYTEQKFTFKVDYNYMTASRDTYSTRDFLKVRTDVSLELVSLKKYRPLAGD